MVGETLKKAREQKNLTQKDVAESTHLLVQIVDDLEKNDFHRIAAAIYGRGFVKLFAEAVGLSPAEVDQLIRNFMQLYNGARPLQVRTKDVPKQEPVPEPVSGPKIKMVGGRTVFPNAEDRTESPRVAPARRSLFSQRKTPEPAEPLEQKKELPVVSPHAPDSLLEKNAISVSEPQKETLQENLTSLIPEPLSVIPEKVEPSAPVSEPQKETLQENLTSLISEPLSVIPKKVEPSAPVSEPQKETLQENLTSLISEPLSVIPKKVEPSAPVSSSVDAVPQQTHAEEKPMRGEPPTPVKVSPDFSGTVVAPETGSMEMLDTPQDDLFCMAEKIRILKRGKPVLPMPKDEESPVKDVPSKSRPPQFAIVMKKAVTISAEKILRAAHQSMEVSTRVMEPTRKFLSQKQVLLYTCAGIFALIILAFGIQILFKMTERQTIVREGSAAFPPPAMYVD